MILTVDPGKLVCGVALFKEKTLIKSWLERADTIEDMLKKWGRYVAPGRETELVIEVPRIYPVARAKGDPNHILDVALVAGAVASRARGRCIMIPPHRWKGQVPKEIMGARIEKRLTDSEAEILAMVKPKGLRHNAIDAVGIGLWRLGRLKA